jgi:hypothetical protein
VRHAKQSAAVFTKCPSWITSTLKACRLPSGCRADVWAELIEVRAGVLQIPIAKLRLLRRHKHSNQHEATKDRDQQEHKPHDRNS